MRLQTISPRLGLLALLLLAAGLAALFLISSKSAVDQTEQAAREKAVTLARTLGYAISGIVRQSPDQEGRVSAVLEEVLTDPEVVAVGIVGMDGKPLMQAGVPPLPALPALASGDYLSVDGDVMVVVSPFEIRKGCGFKGEGCGCGPSICECNGGLAIEPGRYGLAMVVDSAGRPGVRNAVIMVTALGILVLAALVVVVGVLVRSTAAKAALEKRVALEQQRRTSLESMGMAAAGLAHEIRNPLGAIAGYAQLLHEQSEDGPRRERTKLMIRELGRVGERLEEFLGFARKRNVGKRVVDLGAVVKESVALMDADASRRGCSLEYSAPKDVISVDGDAAELKELVTNLLLNAILASNRGGRVEIALGATAAGVVLTVKDDGAGVRPEDLPRVFEPYFTTRPGGSGLGLAIARRIAEDHGAMLTLENNADRGAVAKMVFSPRGSE